MRSLQPGSAGRTDARGTRAAIKRTALVGVAGANGGLLPASLLLDRAATACFVAVLALDLVAAALALVAKPSRGEAWTAVLWTGAAGMAGLGLLGLRQGWDTTAHYGAMPIATALALMTLVWTAPLRLRGPRPNASGAFSLWWALTTAIGVGMGSAGVAAALAGGGPVSSAMLGLGMAVLSVAQHLVWGRLNIRGRGLVTVQPPRLVGTVAGVGGALVSEGALAAALWLIAIGGWLAAGVLARSMVSPDARADALAG